MKAFIIFNDNTEQTVKGKDIRLHRDGPGEFHLTDAYHNHRVLAAFANVREVAMQGKPKKAKQKAPTVETLKIAVDTTELVAGLRAAIMEIEDLVQQGQLVNRADVAAIEQTAHTDERHTPMPNPTDDDLNDPVFNAIFDVIKSWDVNSPQHYHGYCSANGSHAKLILDALRATLEPLAFVPPDVATAVQLLDAELLVFLDHANENAAIHGEDKYNIGFENGIRFAISKLTGKAPTFSKVLIDEGAIQSSQSFQTTAIIDELENELADALTTPTRIGCSCPPKRNIIERGHMSSCPSYEPTTE